MITRYVNTASTAGGDGTTNATTGASRAFVSLGAAFTALAGSAFSDDLTISCSGGADNSTCSIGTGYVAAGFSVYIVGEDTAGVWDVGKYHKVSDAALETGVEVASTVSTDSVVISGMQFLVSQNNHVAIYAGASAVAALRVSGCLIKVDATSCAYNVIWTRSADCPVTIENCIVAHTGAGVCTGYGIALTSPANAKVRNTLVRGFGIGITTGVSSTAKYCAVIGCSTDFSTNASYCATSAGGGTDPITVADWDAQFYRGALAATNVDFRLLSGSALLGAGLGPSADATVPADDIAGNTREGATASVGPFEHEWDWSPDPPDPPVPTSTRIFGRGTGATDTTGHKNTSPASLNADENSKLASHGQDAQQRVANIAAIGPLYNETVYGLIRFDLSSLAGQTITSAALRLYLFNPEWMDNAVAVSVGRCLTQWGITDTDGGASSSPAAAGEACFSKAKTGSVLPPADDTLWAAGDISPFDCGPTFASFFVDPLVDADGDLKETDVTEMVQEWLDGTNDNNGFMLRIETPSGSDVDEVYYHGHDSVVEGLRPALVVEYEASPSRTPYQYLRRLYKVLMRR